MDEFKTFRSHRQEPRPTDRYVLPFYKSYLELRHSTAINWRKGAINGLMAARNWADLDDCRVRLVQTERGIQPVLSLIPIVGSVTLEQFEKYTDFFAVYNKYMRAIFGAIGIIESLKNVPKTGEIAELYQTLVTLNNSMVNIVKILISAFAQDKFVREDFDFEGSNPSGEAPLPFPTLEWVQNTFPSNVRDLDLDNYVLRQIHAGNAVGDDPDTDLIGSFYRHYRKKMIRQNESYFGTLCQK